MKKKMLIMGIETSCDETAAAVVREGREILSNVVASQESIHSKFGGVVPEIASRKHIEVIIPVIKEALKEAQIKLQDVDAIGATYGPGLLGSLMVGLTAAKGIAYSMKLPFVGINHLKAHLYANFISHPHLSPPLVGLIISGGHTELIYLSKDTKYELLGATRDDAVGEAFDKVARILELSYPGGPAIEKIARKGNPQIVDLPHPHFKKENLDFSFSGIKTAILYYVRELQKKETPIPAADIAASFQLRTAEILSEKLFKAVFLKKVKNVVIGGGVASNDFIREFIKKRAPRGIEIFFPSPALCTDNAAMVALLAYFEIKRGRTSSFSLEAEPGLSLLT